MAAPSVSIVVPCYGRPGQTRDLLGSLARAGVACQVVVVDDASPEPLDAVVAEFPSLNVEYVRCPENRGPAFARNLGVASCESEYIAFTDNDCIVDQAWLDHILSSIVKAPRNIAGVGGKVVAHGRDLFSKYYDYHKILDPWYFRGKNYYVTTANAIFRREAFEQVGGFDVAVRSAGGEDPGLCFKLQNVGFGVGYNPDALVFHQYAPSLSSFMRTFYRYGFGCAGQSTKHYRGQEFVHQTGFGGMDGYDEPA
ncbi:MAG: glycosyltransferase [Brevundimonas sp.]|uniref:glycosyltransferase family 2 protein n=1 Tax=Brevundimonas sp. TaxID=1871086 RepID=UPI002ABC36A1|nr:glycosyltransferase [Brevundimonas sp.]MDZ4112972.1 glycosyltransferase [Brevundimonas sp.]